MITKGVFEEKRCLFQLLGIFTLIYLCIKTLTFYAHSLRVFEFAYIAMIFGLAPSYFLRKVFRFENLIGWMVNSSVLGVLFIPFLFIVLGWMGINLVFIYSTLFLYLCSLLGIVFLLIFADDVSVKNHINFNGVARVDIWFYIILIGYTFILTLLNFDRVNIQWDAFTFWGLDAKYIFQLNQLRDSTLDVFDSFRYTAYYPLYYSIIYDLYGAVAEQYANWINVFLNFLALLLVYNNTMHKGIVQKFFIVTMLIVISYTGVLVVHMFSMYADVLVAFNLLLFMTVLTSKYEFELETYSKRVFLLLLLALSLYFIKSPFIFLSCLLIFTYALYDLKLLWSNRGALVRSVDFWLVFVVIAILYMMRIYYFDVVLKIGGNTPIGDLYLPRQTSLHSLISYVVGLISWLTDRASYLAGMWIFGMLSVFIVNKQRLNKSYFYIYGISFGVVVSYCFIYIINQSDLSSGSLVRYCAIVMYLIPLMFTHVEIRLSPVKSYSLAALLFILSGYIVVKTMTPMPLYEPFTLSTGSYNVELRKEFRIAEATLRISGEAARILIVDDFPNDDLLGNMYIDAISVRYFLMFNSVGGQYMTTKEDLYKYAMQQNADHILLLSYASTFDHCENLLVEDHHYLIKINGNKSNSPDECVFSNDVIFDLSRK